MDSEISIPGYTVQRRDRGQNRRGGGVALLVLDGLKYSRRKDLEDKHEVVWIQVQLRKTKYLVSCVYRAPDESLEVFDYLGPSYMVSGTRDNPPPELPWPR